MTFLSTELSSISDLTLIAIAIGLSMDAFAVSVSNGLCYADIKGKTPLIAPDLRHISGVMTAAGYLLGSTVSAFISDIGHTSWRSSFWRLSEQK